MGRKFKKKTAVQSERPEKQELQVLKTQLKEGTGKVKDILGLIKDKFRKDN
jgi:hypothetical protein